MHPPRPRIQWHRKMFLFGRAQLACAPSFLKQEGAHVYVFMHVMHTFKNLGALFLCQCRWPPPQKKSAQLPLIIEISFIQILSLYTPKQNNYETHNYAHRSVLAMAHSTWICGSIFLRCDGCRVQPIRGQRFHCTSCPDFDFCQSCFKRNSTHRHVFKCVNDDGQRGMRVGYPPAANIHPRHG